MPARVMASQPGNRGASRTRFPSVNALSEFSHNQGHEETRTDATIRGHRRSLATSIPAVIGSGGYEGWSRAATLGSALPGARGMLAGVPGVCSRAKPLFIPSNLDPGAIICLTHRKREQPESISGQNCLARGEMIEADPSIANPNRTLQQAAGVGSA